MDKPNKNRKWWKIAAAALLLLLVTAGVVNAILARRADARLAKVQKLGGELFSEQGRNLSPEERGKRFRELRDESSKLTPDQRRKLSLEREKRVVDEWQKFRKMSPEEKNAYLDERIKQMEEMRERFQAMRAQNGGNGGPFGPPGGGNGNDGGPGGRRNRDNGDQTKKGDDSNNASQAQSQNQNQNGPRNRDPAARETRRKERLDMSTPEFRAARSEMFQAMQQRRKELGLPTNGPGAFGFGGPPGGFGRRGGR